VITWVLAALGLLAISGGGARSSALSSARAASLPDREGAIYEAPHQVGEVQKIVQGPGGLLAAALSYWPAIKALDEKIRALGGAGLVLANAHIYTAPFPPDLRYWMLHACLLRVDWYRSGVTVHTIAKARPKLEVKGSILDLSQFGLESGRSMSFSSRETSAREGPKQWVHENFVDLVFPSLPIPPHVVAAQESSEVSLPGSWLIRVRSMEWGDWYAIQGPKELHQRELTARRFGPDSPDEQIKWPNWEKVPGVPFRSFVEGTQGLGRQWIPGNLPRFHDNSGSPFWVDEKE